MTPLEHLAKRGGPTLEQAEQRYPHGTHARYALCKCRCFACRVAKADYVTKLAEAKRPPWRFVRGHGTTIEHRVTGERVAFDDRAAAHRERDRRNAQSKPQPPNELVPAQRARLHLAALRARGIGLKSAAKAAGMSYSIIERIASGDVRRTRRCNEAKILAVDAAALSGPANVDGRETWDLLDLIVGSQLYTKSWIAMQLGSNTPALQMRSRERVRADKAAAVRKLYETLLCADERFREHVNDASRLADVG